MAGRQRWLTALADRAGPAAHQPAGRVLRVAAESIAPRSNPAAGAGWLSHHHSWQALAPRKLWRRPLCKLAVIDYWRTYV